MLSFAPVPAAVDALNGQIGDDAELRKVLHQLFDKDAQPELFSALAGGLGGRASTGSLSGSTEAAGANRSVIVWAKRSPAETRRWRCSRTRSQPARGW